MSGDGAGNATAGPRADTIAVVGFGELAAQPGGQITSGASGS